VESLGAQLFIIGMILVNGVVLGFEADGKLLQGAEVLPHV